MTCARCSRISASRAAGSPARAASITAVVMARHRRRPSRDAGDVLLPRSRWLHCSSSEEMSHESGSARMPVVYVPHGGGPWPFVDVGLGSPAELEALASYLRSLRDLPAARPKAVLAVSAHWEEAVPTVMTSPSPPMLTTTTAFPRSRTASPGPRPGDPALAERVRSLLAAAGIPLGRRPEARLRSRDVRPAQAHVPGRRRPDSAALPQGGARSRGAPGDRPRACPAPRRGRVHRRERHELPQPPRLRPDAPPRSRRPSTHGSARRRRSNGAIAIGAWADGRRRRPRARHTRARSTCCP